MKKNDVSIEFDPQAELPFLSDQFMVEMNEILQFSDELLAACYRAIALMRENRELRKIAWESHLKFCKVITLGEDGSDVWPERDVLEQRMGQQAGMFAAVVLISCLPQRIEAYRAKGIPTKILTDTMSDVEIWMRHFYNEHGVWGLSNIGWLKNHLSGRLFRVGRLQFISSTLRNPIQVYRNKTDGELVAFPTKSTRYRSDGLVDGTNDIYDSVGGWVSRYEIREDVVIGTPFSPTGYALREPVYLSLAKWQPILKQGDPILEIHIAEGSKMTYDLCRESYEQALQFYPKYFPNLPFTAFVCGSWLLGPQYQQLLPDSSNIVRFQKDFYLYPIHTHERDTFERVFGHPTIDPATASRDTSLQRTILDYMAEGGRVGGGAGFIMKEDIEG